MSMICGNEVNGRNADHKDDGEGWMFGSGAGNLVGVYGGGKMRSWAQGGPRWRRKSELNGDFLFCSRKFITRIMWPT